MENQPTAVSSPAVQFETRDAEQNKFMGVLAYLGPLVFVPFFTKKESPFAQFHAKQGITLFVVDAAYFILSFLLRLIKVTKYTELFGEQIELGRFTPGFITWPLTILSIAIGVLAIIGILNAIKGKKKPLPLIGGIKIIK
jgi:uncharacterized Tic20 family protein